MLKKLILIPALFFMGCDDDKSSLDLLEQWQDKNIDSYSFNYSQGGFIPSSGTWRIQVVQGEVIHTQHIEDGNLPADWEVEILPEDAPIIDDFILSIIECEEDESCSVSRLEIDETYHFPLHAFFSHGEEGYGFSISEFEVQ